MEIANVQYTKITQPLDEVHQTLDGISVRWPTSGEKHYTVAKDFLTEDGGDRRLL